MKELFTFVAYHEQQELILQLNKRQYMRSIDNGKTLSTSKYLKFKQYIRDMENTK